MKKKIILMLIITFISCIGCSNYKAKKSQNLLGIDFSHSDNNFTATKYKTSNPLVALKIKNYGAIVIELYPNKASNTVNNFIYLVKRGFYDNNTFHRLIPGFVLQGGDPTGTGSGGPGYKIAGEFIDNGYQNNDLKHVKWIVSMARSNSYDSAGSQFFIMLGEANSLDGKYAAFGKVVDGRKVIDSITNNEQIADINTGRLVNNLVIEKALVDLRGYQYSNPEIISN